LTVSQDRRTVSIPAPGELRDLQAVTDVLAGAAVAVDEVALRRPTLDDAFLALTGSPSAPVPTTDHTLLEVLA
jgi:ABC-2 type transport system ATP-binding protein